jgi:hypothetical protein
MATKHVESRNPKNAILGPRSPTTQSNAKNVAVSDHLLGENCIVMTELSGFTVSQSKPEIASARYTSVANITIAAPTPSSSANSH